jgi:hypothetical protein
MARPQGGYIGKTPTWSASARPGVWTLREQQELQAQGLWPILFNNIDNAFGWNQSADTYAWYPYNGSTSFQALAGNEDYIDLDVQSRMRRCVINGSTGAVNYYLDADDSTKKAGDWLRIVERQTISTFYTGNTFTETASGTLRSGASAWAAGTYSKGARVTHNGSLWECLATTTTATPAAGTVVATLTGGDGMVMVEIPLFSTRHSLVSNVHVFQVKLGNVSTNGYAPHPAFLKADGSYRPHLYLGGYQGTGGTTSGALTSVSGANNVVNATRATFRTAASGRGSGWHQLGYYEMAAAQYLMISEFQSMNTQKVLGNGAIEGSVYVVATGPSNSRGNRSGNQYTSGGSNSDYMSYRGLENIYGRAWQWADGFNANGTSVYLASRYSHWADDTATNYTLVGTIASGSGSYQTALLDLNGVCLPSTASGGSATTFIGDGLWTSTGWLVASVGGGTGNGSLVGAFCLVAFLASSHADSGIGGRLAYGVA